jgi:putative hydroxymethylpyrimidine transport system substrate-binding protein
LVPNATSAEGKYPRSSVKKDHDKPRLAGPAAKLAAGLSVVLLLGGCGSATARSALTASKTSARPATLMLDFTPNAIHTGIYTALAKGYDKANGVDLHVRVPGESTDAISLLTAGKVDFAILDIHDLALADAKGDKLVGIMAVVERPLAAVIAQPSVTNPRQLVNKTVGVTGDPSDLAVLHSIVAGAGGNPAKLKTITIGYDAVPDLIAGRVSGATAFWNDEGVQLSHQKPPFHVFKVDDYGAPAYPELVVTATAAELKRDPGLARRVVRTLVDGYDAVLAHPQAGEQALTSQVTGLSAKAVNQQLQVELPAFLPKGGGGYGTLQPTVLNAWAKWEKKFGIVKQTPDVAKLFNSSFLPK